MSMTLQRVTWTFAAVCATLCFAVATAFIASPAQAACIDHDNNPTTPCIDDGATSSGALGADDLLPDSFTNQTGLGDANLEVTIGALIKTVIRFLGIIAVIVVLYGGFRWMTASGNDEKVAEAKRILIAGLIGLAIVLTALAITTFVINQILGATQESIIVQ